VGLTNGSGMDHFGLDDSGTVGITCDTYLQ
jgi:hypothetical protein